MAQNINQITAPRVDFLDQNGKIAREWYMYLYNLYTITGGGTGVTPVINGGTGLSTIPTNGQLLIGNGTGYTLNTLGFGAGISVTNGSGTISIANTGVLSNIAGTGISVSGATGNVTIANTGVLSFAGGTTGLTPAAATTGAVTLAGKLVIANGGTNSTATPTAYGVAYGTGSAYAFTAAGTTGQVLTATTGGAPTWAAPATSGTVTSVGLALPAQFTVTNSPVTSSGTLTGSWNNQTANYVLAGPTAGAAAVPTFRALVAADIPSLSYVTSVTGTAPVVSSGGLTPAISMAAANTSTNGYLTSTDWNTFNNKGSGTVTSVAALTLGTTGTDLTSTVANGTTTPVITLNVPTASATNRGALSAADWTTFNNKGSGSVTSVSFTGGLITVATATTTPALTVAGTSGGIVYFSSASTWASSAALTQYGVVYGGGAGGSPVATAAGTTGQVLTATTGGAPTWAAPATNGTVTSVSVVSANGFAGTVATATTTPAITLTTSITGLLKGNGTAISAAVSGTDYAPATSGTSILYGNGSGGFSNVTVGSGLSFSAGTLAATTSAPSAPVTKTADFTVAATDVWLINNKSGSTCTVTLPTASTNSGRVLYFQNYQTQTLVSASSNVVPLAGGSAATSILLASSGDSATLVSDGTNWLMTQYVPNNILLLG
jgi:hypothetical protein